MKMQMNKKKKEHSIIHKEQTRDTVSTDEEDYKVNADDDAERLDASVRLNTVVHDDVPIFTG